MECEPYQDDGSGKIFGMENFGNTCYCNSVLQCLYYSKPFREHILKYRVSGKNSGTQEEDQSSTRRSRPRRTSVAGSKPHPFCVEHDRLLAASLGGGATGGSNGAINENGSAGMQSPVTGNHRLWSPSGSTLNDSGDGLASSTNTTSKIGRKMSLFRSKEPNNTKESIVSSSSSKEANDANSNTRIDEHHGLTINTGVGANTIGGVGANTGTGANTIGTGTGGGETMGNSPTVSTGGSTLVGLSSPNTSAIPMPLPTVSQEAQKCQNDVTRPGLRGLAMGQCYTGQNVPVVGFTDDAFATPEARKRAALLKGPIINLDVSMAEEYGMKESLLTALKDIFECTVENRSRTGVISPQKLIDLVKQKNELFRSSAHQDAHEFFNFLLNEVIEELDVGPSDLESSASSGTGGSNQSVSWIHELFEGLLTSETKCLTCETVSRRDEQFLDLSIDLERNTSITSCLKQFSASEMMCERNKFHCDPCGGLQEAEKRIKLKRLPKILALHLKRFKFTEDMQRNVKLFHRVMYPKTLRLVNTTFDAEDPEKLYELCSVIVHIGGGPYHGHYVSVVKTEHMGWLMFDDEMVESVDANYVFNFFGNNRGMATAYVLFYQQVDQATYERANSEPVVVNTCKESSDSSREEQQDIEPLYGPTTTTTTIDEEQLFRHRTNESQARYYDGHPLELPLQRNRTTTVSSATTEHYNNRIPRSPIIGNGTEELSKSASSGALGRSGSVSRTFGLKKKTDGRRFFTFKSNK